MLPSAPSFTTTMLGTVLPGGQLRSDDTGRPASLGYTVRLPLAVVPVTVTLRATAFGGIGVVVSGTPPWPETCTVIVWPGPTGPRPRPTGGGPTRVSTIRLGTTAVNRPWIVGVAVLAVK